MDSQKKTVEKKNIVKNFILFLTVSSVFINTFFSFIKKIVKYLAEVFQRFNRFLSPEKIVPGKKAVYFISMFLFSFFIIACETLQFHMLSIVSTYLSSTTIISVALLGIAIGGLVAYYCGRFNFYAVTALCAIFTFISLIYSYYNIINIESIRYPYFLILPFIFSSVIISTVFIHGNSNSVYFVNLIASAIGVIYPIILVPIFKSETSLFLLLLVPVLFFFILSLRITHIILKLAVFAAVIFIGLQVYDFIGHNISFPKNISAGIYENKILPELGDKTLLKYKKNAVEEFFLSSYKKNKTGNEYLFSSDDYDLSRAEYLLGRSGFLNRYKIPFAGFFETVPQIDSAKIIPAYIFEQEIIPFVSTRYGYYFDRNYDRTFFDRVFKLDKNTGGYVPGGSDYDLLRAKYLLADLGHTQTFDLMFDIRPNFVLEKNRKIYNKPGRILLSQDSLLGRVEYTGDDDYMMMSINGVILDGIDNYNGAFYDPRVPHLKDANIFIIGLSADGIVKSAKRLPGAKVSGIEINPVIMKTMQNGQFAEFARMPYENTEVFFGEGRSFLESNENKYDIISLMNIHSEHSVISTLSPENFHTIEGTKLLLNKITDRGIVDYEEILGTERTDLFFFKFLNTVKQAMTEMGIKNPEKHIFIYRWGFSTYENVFRTVYIKKTPYTQTEIKEMNSYIQSLTDSKMYYNIEVMYSPASTELRADVSTSPDPESSVMSTTDLDKKNFLEKFITGPSLTKIEIIPDTIDKKTFINILSKIKSDNDMDFLLSKYKLQSDLFHSDLNIKASDKTRLNNILRTSGFPVDINLEPVTDDKPFPFNVFQNKSEVKEILYLILVLSLVLIIPVFFLMTNNIGKYKISLLKCILFAALTGFGFMLVEIVLMQKFQKFIGNPNYTLILILGGILFFSGIGSFTSRYMSTNVKIILVFIIPVLLLLKLLFLDEIFITFAKFDFNSKLIISLCIIMPISFLIGIPFPNALEVIKTKTSHEFGALMFGISGFFSTLASVISIMINVSYGFSTSFLTGIIFYLSGILLFILILKKRKV